MSLEGVCGGGQEAEMCLRILISQEIRPLTSSAPSWAFIVTEDVIGEGFDQYQLSHVTVIRTMTHH